MVVLWFENELLVYIFEQKCPPHVCNCMCILSIGNVTTTHLYSVVCWVCLGLMVKIAMKLCYRPQNTMSLATIAPYLPAV